MLNTARVGPELRVAPTNKQVETTDLYFAYQNLIRLQAQAFPAKNSFHVYSASCSLGEFVYFSIMLLFVYYMLSEQKKTFIFNYCCSLVIFLHLLDEGAAKKNLLFMESCLQEKELFVCSLSKRNKFFSLVPFGKETEHLRKNSQLS